MVTKEEYVRTIERMRRDDRLQTGDMAFLIFLLNLFETRGEPSLHLTMRDYMKEMPLSMGVISSAIPKLVSLGYIQGGLYPNQKGHDSWRLSLPPAPNDAHNGAAVKKPIAVHRHQHDGLVVTITFEEVEEEKPPGH